MTGRVTVNPKTLPIAPGWSHAVKAGGWIFGSGMMATDYATGLSEAVLPETQAPWLSEPLGEESRLIIESIEQVLNDAGADIKSDLIRVWQWIKAVYPDDASYAASRMLWPRFPNGTAYARNYAQLVTDGLRASTGIGVRELPIPGALLSVDYLAVEPRDGVEKEAIALPDDMPKPRAGYAPIVRHGDWIFLSGYGGVDFQGDWMRSEHMGELGMLAPEARINPYIWVGSEIEAQMEYTLQGIARMAEAAGSSLERAVKADVTITTPADFPGMDRVWKKYFPGGGPARNVMTGAQTVLKGVRLEVAMVFLTNASDQQIEIIEVPGIGAPIGHAPQAIHAGDFLFTSTLLPVDETRRVPQLSRNDLRAPRFRSVVKMQTELLVAQVDQLCTAAGSSLRNVCKVQSFMADLAHLPEMLNVWRDAFPESPPALSAVEMGGSTAPLILPDAVLQWDVIAYAPRT